MKFRLACLSLAFVTLHTPAFAASPTLPVFPIVLAEGKAQNSIKGREAIYSQAFKPRSAVKTNEALTFPLKTRLIFGSHPDVTVPAGTVLVEAILDGQTVYCGAFRQKKPDMNGASDVGFCLRGTSDRFNEVAYLVSNPDAVLTPYEIHDNAAKSLQWQSISMPYEGIAVDDSLTANFEIFVATGLVGGGRLFSRIQWPMRLRDTAYANSPVPALFWSSRRLDDSLKGIPLTENIELTPGFAVSVKPGESGYAATWTGNLPDGDAVLSLAWKAGQAETVQYIFKIDSLGAK